MANVPLPELLRDLGVETLLDDPETLHRMAEVALDRAGLAANGRAPEEYRLEVELFEWCTKRLALLAAEDRRGPRASLRSAVSGFSRKCGHPRGSWVGRLLG